MRRVLAGLFLGCVLAVAWASPAVAVDGQGDPDNPPDSCFEVNADGDLPTCTYDGTRWERSYPDGASGAGGGIVALMVLVGVAGVGFTVYRVSMARRLATRAGMDPGEATAMTLLSDDGLAATYLASNLRPAVPSARGDATPGRSATERLAELSALLEQGLVTQAEHDERRAAILGSI